MAGRTGRGRPDRCNYGSPPKYLSAKAPVLQFSKPNLSNNRFFLLGKNLYNGEIVFSAKSAHLASLEKGLHSSSKEQKLEKPSSTLKSTTTKNGKSTSLSVQKNSVLKSFAKMDLETSHSDYTKLYARRKSKQKQNQKTRNDAIKNYYHSLRANENNKLSNSKATQKTMNSTLDANTNKLPDAIMQTFLHAFVRKSLSLSKLTPMDDSDDAIMDDVVLTIPPESDHIELYDDLISSIKAKLGLYFSSRKLLNQVDTLHDMDHDSLLLAAYRADTALRNESNSISDDSDMNDAGTHDGASDRKRPAPPDSLKVDDKPSTQGHQTQMKDVPGPLDKNTSTNIGMFTTKVAPEAQYDPKMNPTPGTTNSSNNKRKELEKTTITCRFRIKIQQNMCNIPYLARQVAHQVRKADNGMTILPFEEDTSNDSVLDNETLLPDNEQDLKVWVANTYTYRDNVNFSMKFSVLKTFKTITNALFPWMSKNNSFVKMDRIRSEKIVTVGFFTQLHPDYHNRDDFKAFCKKHVPTKTSSSLSDDISVYARSVYAGAGIHKVTSRVCVIECAVGDSDLISEAFSYALPERYKNVTFVPFTKHDDSYGPMLRAALIEQNLYLQNTCRLYVKGLTHIDKYVPTLDNDGVTPRTWLMKVEYEGSIIIQDVERNDARASNILFHKNNENAVLQLYRRLPDALLTNFTQQVIDTFFSHDASSVPSRMRSLTANETSYMETLKQRYANPQDSEMTHVAPPPQRRKTITYGQAVRSAAVSAHPDFTTAVETDTFDARLKKIEDKLDSLPTAFDGSNENTMSVTSLIETSVTKMGDSIRLEFEKKMKDNNISLATELMTQFQAMLNKTLNPGSTATPAVTQESGGKS